MNEHAYVTANTIAIALDKGEEFHHETKITPKLLDVFNHLETYENVEILWDSFEINGHSIDWFQKVRFKGESWTIWGSLWDGGIGAYKN